MGAQEPPFPLLLGRNLTPGDWEVESWRRQLCHQWTGLPGMVEVVKQREVALSLQRERLQAELWEPTGGTRVPASLS